MYERDQSLASMAMSEVATLMLRDRNHRTFTHTAEREGVNVYVSGGLRVIAEPGWLFAMARRV
jgi:hypothetical protein